MYKSLTLNILTLCCLVLPAQADEAQSQSIPAAPVQKGWRLVDEKEIEAFNTKQYPAGEEWRRYQDLGVYHFNSGQYHQAEYEIKQGIEWIQKTGQIEHLANFYSLLGTAYRAESRMDEAVQAYQQSISAQSQKTPSDQASIAITLNNIGEVYRAEKQFEKALPYLLQAKSKLSEGQAAYDILMQNLGMVYVALNQFPDAEKCFKASIDQALGTTYYNPKQAVDSMYSLSLLYGKQKRLTDLEPLLEKAVTLSKVAYGEGDEHTQNLLAFQRSVHQAENLPGFQWKGFMDQGTASMHGRHYSQAVTSFEKALNIVEHLQTPQQKALAVTHANLGTAYLLANMPANAQIELATAILMYKKYLPTDLLQLQALEKGIAMAKSRQKVYLPSKKVSSSVK